MPIYALTSERLERLKKQIAAKKAEHDELEKLSEKDLWCRDLDEFSEEWERQKVLDNEIKNNIRNMGRRRSKKIGAGGSRGKRAKGDDDDFDPGKPAKAARTMKKEASQVKRVVEPPKKQSLIFNEMFNKKVEPKFGNDGQDSDDDFSALAKSKPVPAKKPEPAKKPSPVEYFAEDSEFEEITAPAPTN